MRIIDYYNYIAVAAYILMGVAAIYFYFRGKRKNGPLICDRAAGIIFALIMIVAAFLRLYRLGDVPYGLQQDEASIGYDAYTLATYGIDRNGYHFPIYPITWGCGGGSPLLIYLNVISIKLFGTGIIKLRLIPAILGIATVWLFYHILRLAFSGNIFKNELSLLGTFFLAICPWHVILSRWSLDCNIMPFNLMFAVYFFLLAARSGKSYQYCISAAAFSICMYSYGAATIVVPLTLILICAYSLKNGLLTVKQLIMSAVTFIVIFAPLLWFYSVNYLGLPEYVTESFSVNKFTAARTGEAFISFDSDLPVKLFGNLKSMALAISFGDESYTRAHYLEGYATLFEFTFPVTLLGLVLGIKDLFTGKRNSEGSAVYGVCNAMMLSITAASVILNLMIIPDINRMVMMFIPFIYFFVLGAGFIASQSGKLLLGVVGVLLIGAVSFGKDYFTRFNEWSVSIYMPGYGDAIKRAYEVAGDDRMIRSTYDGLSSPFMLALYYNEYDPHEFYTTVEYKDAKAEFRVAKSFGNFIFELPEDVNASEYQGDVFVISSADRELFDDLEAFTVEDFGGYFVAYK
jgi:hypothetical protein